MFEYGQMEFECKIKGGAITSNEMHEATSLIQGPIEHSSAK